MTFHGNRLLPADDSLEISYHIGFRKLRKMSQNVSPAAVVIDALKVKLRILMLILMLLFFVLFLLNFLSPFFFFAFFGGDGVFVFCCCFF